MLRRNPIAANRFYPGNPAKLQEEVQHWLNSAPGGEKPGRPWALMLPHAGYIFCGSIMGKTLAGQTLPSRLIILCPNHTGRGAMLSIWPEGEWLTPLGAVPVNLRLANEILEASPLFQADTMAHAGEHSIEVILPFLQERVPDLSIVPICVGTQNPQILRQAARALASVLKQPQNQDCGMIISSDMNHYEDEQTTIKKDEDALRAALAANPDELLKTVRAERISMCGAGPMALALYTANDLGKVSVEFAGHDTSGKASGDFEHVVGYAGLRLYM